VLLAPDLAGHDQAGLLEHAEVLHDPEPGHGQLRLELGEGTAVALAQAVEEQAPGGIGQGPEHGVVIHYEEYM
jgi:hypothetical protein